MALAAVTSTAENTVIGLAGIAAGLFFYFIPALTALSRRARSTGSVVVVNLFLGWTVIGWIVALAMAFRSAPATGSRQPPRITTKE